ncbi:hypothetical protein QYS48_31855 [Marivirga arenosa]|uniref:Uncharacterized protein n=1 Tax=Marivirga arenosa TaxID=3059076 RepID=A0AA51N7Y2_9BACT|nr:hypothetical protein [Marivirga sp. ABR2-2]WMN06181.1 hypothetical protein QYS48_31855 [Marivirga sp. ABR2-2]
MKKLFVIFCFFSLAATCQNQKKTTKENPCDPTIICTMEFKVIKLEIVDSEGNPVQLDEYYTEIEDKKIIVDKDLIGNPNGIYPVASDDEMDKVSFEGDKLTFIGLLNGEKVVKHTLVIGKDCCHIQLIKGEQKIEL